MGIKRGETKTINGDIITVTFVGENITDAALTLASSPVILQMDGGGREYKPVQYTTASISCISNGLDLLQLCVQNPLDIVVEVRNATREKVLFAGYVTPNTLSQSIDSIDNEIVIECVDWLGISQFVKYTQIGDEGLQVITVREALLHTVSLLTSSATILMGDFVGLGIESRYTTHYPELHISEGVFFHEVNTPYVEDDGTLSISRNALSCYDVLIIIAESVRATWVQDGYNIILNDNLNMLSGIAQKYYILHPHNAVTDDEKISLGNVVDITAEVFSSTGNNVSRMKDYSYFSLKRSRKDISVMPNIFAFNNLVKRGNIVRGNTVVTDSQAKVSLVQLLKSSLVTFTNSYEDNLPNPEGNEPVTAHPSAVFFGKKIVETKVPIINDAPEFLIYWDDTWENCLRIYKPAGPSRTDYVQVNISKSFSVPVLATKTLSLQIEMEAGTTYGPLDIWDTEPDSTIDNILVSTQLKCGNHYYNIEEGEWVTYPTNYSYLNIFGQGQAWKKIVISTKTLPSNIIAGETKDGVVDISFRFFTNANTSNSRASVEYFRNLDIKVVPSILAKRSDYFFPTKEVTHKRVNDYDNDYSVVELPVTFGFPHGTNIYSACVEDVEYVTLQSLGGVPEIVRFIGDMFFISSDGDKYTMLERIERLASFGDKLEFNLFLKDTGNTFTPITAYTSPIWTGHKIVMGYQRDIKNETINITLD